MDLLIRILLIVFGVWLIGVFFGQFQASVPGGPRSVLFLLLAILLVALLLREFGFFPRRGRMFCAYDVKIRSSQLPHFAFIESGQPIFVRHCASELRQELQGCHRQSVFRGVDSTLCNDLRSRDANRLESAC